MATQPLRIIFMGTPGFSVPALKILAQAGHEIVCVYTQPPRRAGRGKKETPSPVEVAAREMGLVVRSPEKIRSESDIAEFTALDADIAVVVAYGQILPRAVLDAPRLGCINIHASLLPRWRGAAPIQRAIMNGDSETGISIMQMDEGLDTGAVLASEAVAIGTTMTAPELHDILAGTGAGLVLATIAALAKGEIEPEPQDDSRATYAAKLDKAENRIDWSESPQQVLARVRGLYPYAWFEVAGERIRVLAGEPATGNARPGEVITASERELVVAAAAGGAVKITRLQRAGKGPMAWDEFARGNPIQPGTILS